MSDESLQLSLFVWATKVRDRYAPGGRIVTIVSLRTKLGFDLVEYNKSTMIMVVEVKGAVLGLIPGVESRGVKEATRDSRMCCCRKGSILALYR
jgi:hypothetical protein